MSGTTASVETSASLAETILGVMNDLTKVLVEELNLVKRQDVEAIRELSLRKNKLILQYHGQIKVLAAQPDLLKQTSASTRARLKAAGEKLAEVSERNATSLRAAVQATRRVLQNVINLVRKEAFPQQGYSDLRKSARAASAYSPLCPPVAVNRTA